VRDEGGVGDDVLREPAVDVVAGAHLLRAERLPAGEAVVAAAAGPVQPRHPDPVAEPDLVDPLADLDDLADGLVAGDPGKGRLVRPVAVHGVQVGVADAAGPHLDQHLAVLRDRDRDVPQVEVLAEPRDDGGPHRGAHADSIPAWMAVIATV
jgi:hypothetical protein